MAIPTNIKTLLSGEVVEWARIEFKETWNAEASLKSVCAFANDLDNWGGGYIVIGVEEHDGQPIYPLKGVPVDKMDAYQKNILSKCKLIRPAYMPIVEVVDYENKKFIVLWCPGGDSRPYSSEGLKSYRVSNRRYRNRRIGDFLKELHLTEGRNTGFKKILDALEANGSPKPEFETDEGRSYFITRLFVHEGFLEDKNEDENVSTPNSTPSTPNSTPSSALTETLRGLTLREQILILIKKNPSISKKKMTEILGVSMYALKKELAVMGKEHVAEFVGFSRSGKWVVYKLN